MCGGVCFKHLSVMFNVDIFIVEKCGAVSGLY